MRACPGHRYERRAIACIRRRSGSRISAKRVARVWARSKSAIEAKKDPYRINKSLASAVT